jgi:PST family polysaccharide transporter
MMADQVFRQIISLLLVIWIARQFGPHGMGALSYALSICALVGIVTTLGLNRILVRELAYGQSAQESDELVCIATTLRLCAGFVGAFAAIAACAATSPENLGLVAILSLGYFATPFDTIDLYFQSRLESRRIARARMVAFLCSSAFKASLLDIGVPLAWIAVAFVLDGILAALALHGVFRHGSHRLKIGLGDGRIARRLLGESWPEIIAGFSGLMFMRIDQVMLQVMRGSAEVGLMAVSSRLTEAWLFIPTAIVSSVYPVVVRLMKTDPAASHEKQRTLYRVLLLISVGVAGSLTLLAKPLIEVLYGSAYSGAAHVLVIQAWSGVFMCLGVASGAWLMANRLGRLNLYRNLAGAALNVLLNAILIPRFGAVGAAWASLVSFAFAYLAYDFVAPEMRAIGREKLRALIGSR